jgi:hypothetical protein
MSSSFETFAHKISAPIKFRFFLATKLPAAFFVGLRIKYLNEKSCGICIKHSWFSKNPFKSVYFAAEAMAAEMSTGLLAFGHIYLRKPKVSMLVVNMEANFIKKGTGRLVFTCSDGDAIGKAIEQAINTGEGVTIISESIGRNEANEIVASFKFTWSFKAKS